MDEIAAHAGLGIGTLYRHFPTKDALFTAMVRDRFGEVEEMAALAVEIPDPLQALTTIMRRSGELVQDDTAFQLAIMGPDKLKWDGIDEQMGAMADNVKRVIARAVDAGVVRADFSYNDYLMIMCGITATTYYKPGNADWRRYLELVLDGLQRRGGGVGQRADPSRANLRD